MNERIAGTDDGPRRTRRLVVAMVGVTALAGLLTTRPAEAQTCSAIRASGGKFAKMAFARTQPDCGAPDTTALGGIPACTGHTPATSDWAMDPKTKITLSAKSDKTGNVQMQLSASGIVNAGGAPVDGTGALRLTVRFVLEDPTGSPKTTQPIDLVSPVLVSKGKAKVSANLNEMLTGAGFTAVPPCFRADLVMVGFEDPNGNQFGAATSPLFSERSGTEYGSRG